MDAAHDRGQWQDFAVGVAGAAAALAGLLVVAISINVREILASRYLPPRAGGALVMLTTPLVLGLLLLIPGQSVDVPGSNCSPSAS
jgi:modulator of FtsH protease